MYKHYTRCFVHNLLFNPHSNTLKWLLLGNWDTEMKQLAPNHIDEVGLIAKPHLQCCNCVICRENLRDINRQESFWMKIISDLYVNIQMSKLSSGIHLKAQSMFNINGNPRKFTWKYIRDELFIDGVKLGKAQITKSKFPSHLNWVLSGLFC